MPEDKGTPVTLYNMYHETKRTLPAESVEEVDLKYQALLQEEEAIVAWDSVEEQKVSVGGDPERPYCRGRDYVADRYGKGGEEIVIAEAADDHPDQQTHQGCHIAHIQHPRQVATTLCVHSTTHTACLLS